MYFRIMLLSYFLVNSYFQLFASDDFRKYVRYDCTQRAFNRRAQISNFVSKLYPGEKMPLSDQGIFEVGERDSSDFIIIEVPCEGNVVFYSVLLDLDPSFNNIDILSNALEMNNPEFTPHGVKISLYDSQLCISLELPFDEYMFETDGFTFEEFLTFEKEFRQIRQELKNALSEFNPAKVSSKSII